MANAKVGALTQVVRGTGIVPGQGVSGLWKVFNAETVNGSATVDSTLGPPANTLGFLLVESHFFGLWIQLSGTSPDVKVQIIQAWDDVAADYAVPAAGGTISASLADTAPHILTISPVPMPFLRIRLVGNIANGTDTTATAYFWQQV